MSRSAVLSILLLTGCLGAEEAATDDPALDEDEIAVSALPEPSVWRVEPEELSPDARRRQIEVDRYIRDNLYRGYEIVETTQTFTGDLIDWVDPASVPGSQIEPPPPIEDLASPPGVSLQRTELDEHPELRGAAGTIPIVRPDFRAWVRGESAGSLEEHLARQQPGVAGVNRYFGGYQKTASTTAVDGYFSHSINTVENGSFSLLEAAVQCNGSNAPKTINLVGATVSKDLANFGDSTLRMRVEFLTAGYSSGYKVGGWDGLVVGFVPAAGRPYGPNIALTPSIPGGTQYESHFRIENYSGNWWVAHNGNWLGYYPGTLFPLIKYQACKAMWYGEVYDPSPQIWTWTDMGSGYFPTTGYPWAAYVRNPFYVSGGVASWPPAAPENIAGSANPACYWQSPLYSGSNPWARYFYLGGPGSPAIGCN